jgi:glycosyltransferase involved in cell wall biosynthesis
MKAPEWIVYNSFPEKAFAERLFANAHKKNVVAGIGITVPSVLSGSSIKEKYKINGKYIIYVGRLDKLKGAKIAIDYFIRFRSSFSEPLQLVVVGKGKMKQVEHPDIVYTGFISDEDKFGLMQEAETLVMPSKYESLSLVVLESMALKVPVIVNAASEVLQDHIQRSDAGFSFNSYSEFNKALAIVLNDREVRTAKGVNGEKYIEANYNWPTIMHKFHLVISDITRSNL